MPENSNSALRDYAAIYRATYGEAESVADLIPFMLSSFLDSDRGFARARKQVPLEAPAGTAQHRPALRSPSQSRSTTNQED